MKNSKLALLLSLCTTVGMFAPAAFAGDSEPLDKVVDASLVPTRAAGAVCGVLVGMPVAALRQTYKNYVSMTTSMADKIGGHECGPSCAVASIGTIPASIVVGTALGIYHGGKNGINGFNQPFNPQSFSVTKDYEE